MPDFEAAYNSAHAAYVAVHQAWDEYQELLYESFTRFMTTEERGSVPERPARPGLPLLCPSKEEFARTYYSEIQGTRCSENRHFGSASSTPGSSRENTPLQISGQFLGSSPGGSDGASIVPVPRPVDSHGGLVVSLN